MNTFPTVRVRFHLAKGQHYMHWQLRQKDCQPIYYSPDDTVLVMKNAELRNRPSVAQKIYEGESDKTVCAWIQVQAHNLYVLRSWKDTEKIMQLVECLDDGSMVTSFSYNPRVAPNWRMGNINADNLNIPLLFTTGRQVFSLNINQRQAANYELFL